MRCPSCNHDNRPRAGRRSHRAPRAHGRVGARRRDGKPIGCALGLWSFGRCTACRPPVRRGAGDVATALAVATQTGQPFWDAYLHRLDGDLLLATGGTDEAAARYHRALAIAREQGACSLELRAATSLARLWRDQGKRAEARATVEESDAWLLAMMTRPQKPGHGS